MGEMACNQEQRKLRTIYWGHDEVLSEYYGLTKINPCGDPAIECEGNSNIIRPSFKH